MQNAIMTATQVPSAEMRALAFQCLDQVAQLYYEHLADYMTEIFQLTTRAMQNDPEDSVKMAAIEFWSTIAEAEQTVVEKSLVRKLLPPDPPGASGFVNDTHGAPLSTTLWAAVIAKRS